MINSGFSQIIAFAHIHSFLFVFIVIMSLIVIFIFTILLFNPKNKNKPVMAQKIHQQTQKQEPAINTHDIHAIAGEDVFITQLDLARAYIELGKKSLAKQILENVTHYGNHQQQITAHELLSVL